MKKKKSESNLGLVYSTDPNFQLNRDGSPAAETLPPAEQDLRVVLSSKHRGGKTVTLIEGFIGKEADLEDLGKKLKSHCGTGGSAKDGEIIVQGDHREKVMQWLLKNGYKRTKKKGG